MFHGCVGASVTRPSKPNAPTRAHAQSLPANEAAAADSHAAGDAQEQDAPAKPARILIDTGSDHSFVHPDWCMGLQETGNKYNVNLAKKGSFLLDIPEVMLPVKFGDYEAELPALKLPLAACRYRCHPWDGLDT